MNEEEYKLHEQAVAESKSTALAAVMAMNLPRAIALSHDSFLGLGKQSTRLAIQILSEVNEQHGERTPELIGIALREIWFSLYSGSGYIAAMQKAGLINTNDYMQAFATPQGYGENQGMARTLSDNFGTTESDSSVGFRTGTSFDSAVNPSDIMLAAAVYWFAKAAELRRSGDIDGAFDLLHEAEDALALCNGDWMYAEGLKQGAEPEAIESRAQAAARTALARTAADARHAENRSMKSETFVWLDANMRPGKSMDAAAAEITKLQPITFRTARDWVGEWKKVRSAGRP